MKPALPAPQSGESSAKADNRRAFPRIAADELPGLSAALGGDLGIRLIDISRGGALFECRKRIIPGSQVALRLMTRDGTHLVRGRIVRSNMVRLEGGGMGYQTGIEFNERLKELLPEPASTLAVPAAPELSPLATMSPKATTVAGPDGHYDDVDRTTPEEAWSATPVILLTANIGQTSDELRELFSNNDW